MGIFGFLSFCFITFSMGFDPTNCACAYDMSNRLIAHSSSPAAHQYRIQTNLTIGMYSLPFTRMFEHTHRKATLQMNTDITQVKNHEPILQMSCLSRISLIP